MQAYAAMPGSAPVLPDRRLHNRLQRMLDSFSDQPHRSIPQASGNRNAMDAAYNFFKNRRVQPGAVVRACLAYTLDNLHGCQRVLAVQDTSEANFSGLQQTPGLGPTDGPGGRGLKFHSCLAITADGVPAGLLSQQIWARRKTQGPGQGPPPPRRAGQGKLPLAGPRRCRPPGHCRRSHRGSHRRPRGRHLRLVRRTAAGQYPPVGARGPGAPGGGVWP